MKSKIGRKCVLVLAGLLCFALSSTEGVAQTSAWNAERSAAVEAYMAGDYATAAQRLLAAIEHAQKFE